MKLIAALFLSTWAAAAAGQDPAIDRRLGQALDDFATVAGAWYLNQRCAFIAGTAAASFDSDVATINVALAQDLGDPRTMFRIQAASKSVAASEKYASCDDEARAIVLNRVAHAQGWAERIRSVKEPGKRVQ